MPVIDKNMYERLKDWCEWEGRKGETIMYVNSSDRDLTSATIRKMIVSK